MSALQGTWIWYELITGDDAGAKAFYEAVVGWTVTPGTEPPMNYGVFGDGGQENFGGILPLTAGMAANGARAAWLGYIAVDDADAAVAAIEARGGRLLLPPVDLDVGRIAMVADPDGAAFYVMTPKPPQDGRGAAAFDPVLPGRCSWNELHAANQQGALDFYTGLFGWTLAGAMDMGPMGTYQFVDHGGVTIGAVMTRAPERPSAGWTFYFRVEDIGRAAAAVSAHGGQVLHGPHEVPGGDWIINGIDPQGAAFALVGSRGAGG